MRLNFRLFLEDLEQVSSATVYHRTSREPVNGIIKKRKLIPSGGQFGNGVYCFLEEEAAKAAVNFADFIIAAKIDLKGFVPMSGVNENIKNQIYGTPYTSEIRNILYKGNVPNDVNKIAFELDEIKRYMPHCPGIIMQARPNNRYHWVVVFNGDLLKPYAFAEHKNSTENAQWQKF